MSGQAMRQLTSDEIKAIVKMAISEPDTVITSIPVGDPISAEDRVCFLRCEPIGWTIVVVGHTDRCPLGGPAEVITFDFALSEDDARDFASEQYGMRPEIRQVQ